MDAKEIEALVGELETNCDRLRGLYEQYFMGIERIAPSVAHKDVERRIYALRKEQIRNTAVRFRFQMIVQRYNTYQTHWQRICRQIEEGTYKRDRLRAERSHALADAPKSKPPEVLPVKQEEEEEAAPPTPPRSVQPLPLPPSARPMPRLELDDDAFGNLDLSGALDKPPSSRSNAPAWKKIGAPPPTAPPPKQAVPAAAPPPAPPTNQPPRKPPPPLPPRAAQQGISDERLKQIYAQYVNTRQAQKEASAAMSFDALAKTLRESSAKLRPKHGNVDFEVAVKDGRTILRAVVKK